MANTLKFGNGEWYGKKDTILAYNDLNSNYKPLPFDFSRGSSATVINKDGLIETVGSGEARIDYKDDSKGALLLEPSRTNSITYSEDFTNSGWDASAYPVSITSNSIISPDGSLNATLITPTSGNSRHAIRNLSASAVSGNTYTLSVFVKKGVSRYVVFGDAGDSLWRVVTADLDNGVITNEYNSIGTITAYENGWYRITCQITRSNSGTIHFSLGASETNSNSGLPSFDDTSLTIYSFGAQLEIGSYATSYIPTQGGVVTRLADTCSQTPPDGVIGQTEGVLYCEVDVKSGYDTNNLMVTLSNGTNLKQIYINRSNGQLEFFVGTNVNEMLYVTPSVLSNGVHKLALAYKQDDFSVAIDGVIAYKQDDSGNVPTCNKINVGSHYNGNLPFNDRVNDVKLYNTRLSDSELAALTTI